MQRMPDSRLALHAQRLLAGALNREGRWRFRLLLENANVPTFERELLVVAPTPKGFRPLRAGISTLAPSVEEQLRAVPGVTVETFRPDARYDVLIASGGSQDAEKNPAVNAEGSYKPTGPIQEIRIPDEVLDAVRHGTPLLACTPGEGQAAGVAHQLAQAGAAVLTASLNG
jgi:beta-galactosidase